MKLFGSGRGKHAHREPELEPHHEPNHEPCGEPRPRPRRRLRRPWAWMLRIIILAACLAALFYLLMLIFPEWGLVADYH